MLGSMDMGIPALLATMYWGGGFMVGRIVSGLLKNVSSRTQLTFTNIAAIILTVIAIIYNNLWVLAAVGLAHSVMWSSIFTLATSNLREFTSRASGIFMMGVFGGAIFPLLQGVMADMLGSWQMTWAIVIVCELVMLGYALYGSKERYVEAN